MLKPYSFLFYLLMFIFSFFVGILIAGLVEAGKGQMLAGGAIVLGYGVVGAGIGLIFALYLAYKINQRFIVKINVLLFISTVALLGYFYINYQNKQKGKEQEKQKLEQPKQTVPAVSEPTAMLCK